MKVGVGGGTRKSEEKCENCLTSEVGSLTVAIIKLELRGYR